MKTLLHNTAQHRLETILSTLRDVTQLGFNCSCKYPFCLAASGGNTKTNIVVSNTCVAVSPLVALEATALELVGAVAKLAAGQRDALVAVLPFPENGSMLLAKFVRGK
jgi:hypothetical protein